MVKLKIQARVLAEDDYANSLDTHHNSGHKFLVIIRNPEDWYIGTLAHEVSQRYQRMYKQ